MTASTSIKPSLWQTCWSSKETPVDAQTVLKKYKDNPDFTPTKKEKEAILRRLETLDINLEDKSFDDLIDCLKILNKQRSAISTFFSCLGGEHNFTPSCLTAIRSLIDWQINNNQNQSQQTNINSCSIGQTLLLQFIAHSLSTPPTNAASAAAIDTTPLLSSLGTNADDAHGYTCKLADHTQHSLSKSINTLVTLDGAIKEDAQQIAQQIFCIITKPNTTKNMVSEIIEEIRQDPLLLVRPANLKYSNSPTVSSFIKRRATLNASTTREMHLQQQTVNAAHNKAIHENCNTKTNTQPEVPTGPARVQTSLSVEQFVTALKDCIEAQEAHKEAQKAHKEAQKAHKEAPQRVHLRDDKLTQDVQDKYQKMCAANANLTAKAQDLNNARNALLQEEHSSGAVVSTTTNLENVDLKSLCTTLENIVMPQHDQKDKWRNNKSQTDLDALIEEIIAQENRNLCLPQADMVTNSKDFEPTDDKTCNNETSQTHLDVLRQARMVAISISGKTDDTKINIEGQHAYLERIERALRRIELACQLKKQQLKKQQLNNAKQPSPQQTPKTCRGDTVQPHYQTHQAHHGKRHPSSMPPQVHNCGTV